MPLDAVFAHRIAYMTKRILGFPVQSSLMGEGLEMCLGVQMVWKMMQVFAITHVRKASMQRGSGAGGKPMTGASSRPREDAQVKGLAGPDAASGCRCHGARGAKCVDSGRGRNDWRRRAAWLLPHDERARLYRARDGPLPGPFGACRSATDWRIQLHGEIQ